MGGCDSLVWTCWSVFQLFSCEVGHGGGVIPLCGLVGQCSSYFLVRCLMVGV